MANSSYRRRSRNNVWLMVMVCLVGLVIGGYLGYYLSQWGMFWWAGVALEIGTEKPWVINSPLLEASILMKARFNLGSLFGFLVALLTYKLVRR